MFGFSVGMFVCLNTTLVNVAIGRMVDEAIICPAFETGIHKNAACMY